MNDAPNSSLCEIEMTSEPKQPNFPGLRFGMDDLKKWLQEQMDECARISNLYVDKLDDNRQPPYSVEVLNNDINASSYSEMRRAYSEVLERLEGTADLDGCAGPWYDLPDDTQNEVTNEKSTG